MSTPNMPEASEMAFCLWRLSRGEPAMAVRFERCQNYMHRMLYGATTRHTKARQTYYITVMNEIRRLRDVDEALDEAGKR